MFKKVLVPLDGSELSECSLPHISTMAKDDSIGKVILLRIVDINIAIADVLIADQGSYLQAFRDSCVEAARDYLARVESQLKTKGIKVETVVLEGSKPGEIITDFSQQNGVDLIVMATHGYSGIKKMLIGSVAFKVLHTSPVPVLLIRPESCRR